MVNRKSFVSFQRIGWHKGFYNDEETMKTLMKHCVILNMATISKNRMTTNFRIRLPILC